MAGTTLTARTVNALTLRNARSAAFHHPDDQPFAGMSIPQITAAEMPTSGEQIDALIAGFAKQQGRPSGLPVSGDDGGAPLNE